MVTYYLVIFFILGLIFGSFFNVVGMRLSEEKSLIKPKSHCPKCNHVLGTMELVPVFSYIFLGGKCKHCKERISIVYPIVELLSGILFALSFYIFSFSIELLIAISLSSLFLIILVSDFNYYIIPDQVTIFFAIIIFSLNIFKFGIIDSLIYISYGLIIFIFMYLLMFLGNVLFKKESLGGGDIKLTFVLGMTLPLMLSFCGIFLATFLALPTAIVAYLKNKEQIIPFGPFLVLGTLIIYLSKINMETIVNFLLM